MKKLLFSLGILFGLYVGIATYGSLRTWIDELSGTLRVVPPEDPIGDVLDAIIEVESGGDPNAVGRDGELGILQIRPIMVEEVNRIIGSGEYSDMDRLSPSDSEQMFRVYSHYWCEKTGDWTMEGIARRWNGGPRGHLKKATKAYWDRVRARTWTGSADSD